MRMRRHIAPIVLVCATLLSSHPARAQSDSNAGAEWVVAAPAATLTIPTLLGSAITPGTITTDGANLYIGSANNILSMPIGGGLATTLYASATTCCVVGITQAGGNLFWIDPNGDPDATAIFRGRTDGGSRTKVYSGFATGQPIVDGSGLTTDGSRLYAVDEVSGSLVSMNLDGSAITTLGSRYAGGFSTEHLNRVTVSNGMLYIADEGCTCPGGTIAPKILRIPTGGGSFTTLFDAGAGFVVRPHDIAVTGSTIFFTDSINNTIWKMPTSGGTPTAFIAGPPFSRVDGITVLGDALYVTDSGAGRVYKISLSQGAAPVVKRRAAAPPRGVAQLTSLSTMVAAPFTSLTISGTGLTQAMSAVSVRFIPKNGPEITLPVSMPSPTSLQVMVPMVSDPTSGVSTSEVVDVQVIQISGTDASLGTVLTSNSIKGLQIEALLPVPAGRVSGAMTAAFLGAAADALSATNASFIGHPTLSQIGAVAPNSAFDLNALISAINAIAANPGTSVSLSTSDGSSVMLNAQILARSDQVAQALVAELASKTQTPKTVGTNDTLLTSASLPEGSTACPLYPNDPLAYDTNLCYVDRFFQNLSGANQEVTAEMGKALGNLAAGALVPGALEFLGASRSVANIAASPLWTFSYSWLTIGGPPPGGDIVEGVTTSTLDQWTGLDGMVGFAYDAYKVFHLAATTFPSRKGISVAMAVSYAGGGTALLLRNGILLATVPTTQGTFPIDSLKYVVPRAGQPVVLSFAADPTATVAGQPSVLRWTTTNATSVDIAGLPGSQPGSGLVAVAPTATTTYVLTATGLGGAATAKATVTVNAVSSFALNVAKTGTGSGTVTSAPSGIACGAMCSASYASGASVTLTETPATGSTFSGWSGACAGTSTTCTITMNANKSVTAAFNTPVSYSLTTSKAGSGSGVISPSGGSYPSGTVVTLTATAASGSNFGGWSGGGCSGTGSCTVTMNSNITVTATFNLSASNYTYANWNCNNQSQCIAVLGHNVGSAGPFCSTTACDAWRRAFFIGATCTAQPLYTIYSAPSPGTCSNYPN